MHNRGCGLLTAVCCSVQFVWMKNKFVESLFQLYLSIQYVGGIPLVRDRVSTRKNNVTSLVTQSDHDSREIGRFLTGLYSTVVVTTFVELINLRLLFGIDLV